ncbi:MAG: DUF1553 domain-containing protein [Pirellulaceae bacterium]
MKRRSHLSILLLVGAALIWPMVATDLVAEEPVARWEFETEGGIPLTPHGGVRRDVAGPRPPSFPDFPANNMAVQLDGSGARLTLADPGSDSPFDFSNGDEITLEAWIKVRDIREGQNAYIIGKGRTGRAGHSLNNQTWSLRVRQLEGQIRLSFLFCTRLDGATDDDWHRWTTSSGLILDNDWHHVAITYRFGEPESITGWIDGGKIPGFWDAGGPTQKPPVVDDDEIWIGSSIGGGNGVSFRGSLDEIAIHRQVLDDEILKQRFHRVGEPTVIGPAPETMPEIGSLPADQVVMTFHEGLPAHNRWLMENESWPEATSSWSGSSFLIDRLPQRFDDWGIRKGWNAPVAVRMAADVVLPKGKQTLLMRSQGLARVWVDGKLVGRAKPLAGASDGFDAMIPVADPPAPGQRVALHAHQEVTGQVEIKHDGPVRVVVEAIAGGKNFRPETGELTLALRSEDGTSYSVLRPAGLNQDLLPLTDVAVEAELERIARSLSQLDDQTRHAAAAQQDKYWQKRHQVAQAWVEQNPPPAVPKTRDGVPHPIDAFISARIEEAKASSIDVSAADSEHFHSEVLPILQNACFRCHGEKFNGGLALNTREFALTGGDSGEPAITPGDPHASEMIARLRSTDAGLRMPPTEKPLPEEQIQILEKWITAGAPWPQLRASTLQTQRAPIIGDAEFVRRAYLDTVGVVPTEEEVRGFLADESSDKRERLIDHLLEDARWADHWVGYWQDLLAENPTLLNASLNSTGPFRWFLYDAFRDNKSIDRMASELILMRGGAHDGGSAGFALAAQNDSPLAAKGHVVASTFLGIELQCARCHDSPYHSTLQKDLYSLAAMFTRKPVSVPKSSTVPAGFFEDKERESLIKVTLKPGESIPPVWPFAEQTGVEDDDALRGLMQDPMDSREKLAALITSPENTRFAQVITNRVWRRLIGAGIVEPPYDWEGNDPSHPELLEWLAKELMANRYDVKHLTKLIMTSSLYQQQAIGQNLHAAAPQRLFIAPERRRMTAEQIVDSLHVAAGRQMDVEEMTMDPVGRRTAPRRNTFGDPHRSWMLVSLSNERDRPSLTLPRAAMVAEVLSAFGWSAERQAPRTDREIAPNVRQPAVMANSYLTLWLTTAAHESTLADLAVQAKSADELVESIFVRFLSRFPTEEERASFVPLLQNGFESRLVPIDRVRQPQPLEQLPRVTWSNHVRPEANTIQEEHGRRVRQGPPADPRLQPEWRQQYEDFVWSVVNLREFVWMP